MTASPSILITGASGGIGRAAAIECASRGARIGVHYNGNRERAEATLEALEGEGHQLLQCDITDPQAAERLIEEAERSFGGLDVLVNNAGVSQRHNFEDIDYATWQQTWHRIVTTNLTAAGNLCFCAGQKMIARGGGRIVNVSSRGASTPSRRVSSKLRWRLRCWLRLKATVSVSRAVSVASRSPRSWARRSHSWRWKHPSS